MPATVSHTTQSFPFGEEMAAQHAGGAYSTRYKFNGKELDLQTGYYYYGARYYDPVVSRWLSMDPLAEKYPGFSPYNYTLNNPVRMFDPNGKGPQDIILLGTNGSSVTIKTDIIDIKVNAGEILGDIGGNYTLVGDDVLVAALDIAGIFDPTGIADAASGTIEMKNGNFWSGLASYAGIFPYLGDLAKLPKLPKDLKAIKRVISLIRKAQKGLKFRSEALLIKHFTSHRDEFLKVLKLKKYTKEQYIKDANMVIKDGIYVFELNAYIKYIGGKGDDAKYFFVGLTRDGKNITTFHIRNAKKLKKKVHNLVVPE